MEEDLFVEKGQKHFIELTSQWSFFEMCQKKKLKLEQRIPQTIIFDKLVPKMWLFNPKKSPRFEVFKRNQDKLNTLHLVKSLIQLPLPKDLKVETLSQIQDFLRSSLYAKDVSTSLAKITPVAIAQMKRNEAIPLSRAELLSFFMEGKELSSVAFIQQFLPQPQGKSEVFYIEYRHELDFTAVTYKFFKKTLAAKRPLPTKQSLKSPNPFNPLLMSVQASSTVSLTKQTPQRVQTLFKFLDSTLNARFQEECKKIVLFFEKGFHVKVRKIVPKFILDEVQNIYFVGIKSLYIDFVKNGHFQMNIKEEVISNGSMDNFMLACKQFKKKVKEDSFLQMPKTILEEDKKLSKTLYKHLILEKCYGDFCKYKLIELNKGPLQLRKGFADQYKNAFKEAKTTNNNRSTNLPYEISNQMIIRTRDNYKEVIKLFQRFKIYLENCNPDEHPELTLEQQYPFINQNTDVQAVINLYKSVKICKNCFIIYQMIQRHFEQQLTKDVKGNAQFINSKLSDLPDIDKSPTKRMNTTSRQKIYRSQTQKKNFLISTLPDQNELKPQTPSLSIPEHLLPKGFKTATPLKTRNQKQAVCSQIEINRLSLGYLNYQKLEQFHKPVSTESDLLITQQQKLYESQSINLIQLLASVQPAMVKRIDQNNFENKELQQRNEEIKLMLKKTSKKQQETREAHKEYYLQKLAEEEPTLLSTWSFYYYHVNPDVIRKIYQYQLSTPMKAPTYELKFDKLRPLTIFEVCQMMNYSKPCFEIMELEYLVVDQQTAVPFVLFESNITVEKSKSRDGKASPSGIELLIIVQDMFESFFEYYAIVAELINEFPNKRILLFNTPGQAYTLFSKQRTYSNIYVSTILDSILFELYDQNRIDILCDSIKILGIGSGGFHAQAFIVQSQGLIPIHSVILINSFTEIYQQLVSFLTQSQKIFQTQPHDMPELAFEYTNTIMNTKIIEQEKLHTMLELNPISIWGRSAIIEGLLASPPFIERFQKMILSVNVYHSLKNCLVNIQEAEALQTFVQDEGLDINNVTISKKMQMSKRVLNYIEGGHSILYENQESLILILNKLMVCQQ